MIPGDVKNPHQSVWFLITQKNSSVRNSWCRNVAECSQKVFKVINVANNIQVPGMAFQSNAGLPIHSSRFKWQGKQ
jgi:hypothetical protein